MAPNLQSRVLDLGLNVLDTEAEKIALCSAEPTNYTEGNSTYLLGHKTYAAGGAFGAPAAGAPNGRKVTSTAITDGSITGTGTVTHWCVLDVTNTRLLAVGTLSASQAVTNGNTFALPAFDIRIPSQ